MQTTSPTSPAYSQSTAVLVIVGALRSAPAQFAAGWFGGGNRRRFADLAEASSHPMGVLELTDDLPVGWCACGPRARYTSGINGRSKLLQIAHEKKTTACG